MSIFDKLGGTNKFKKGLKAGAKPFEAKFAQHAEALNRLEKKFGADWNKTKAVADQILNSLEATERKRLYGLYSQTDIKTLNSEFKEILIAILYTLGSESGNEFQQSYIRSVQKYLDIKNSQASIIDFSGIGNIDSLIVQKAIFQSCLEYLLLGNGDAAFFEKYGEALFSHFVIKDNDMELIWENVLQIYSAIGPLGLAEKYGFVPEFKDKEKVLSGEESGLEQFDSEQSLNVQPGEEREIENKDITLKYHVNCEGKLIFKNCIIRYNGDAICGQIMLQPNSCLVLSQCTIIGDNNETRKENTKNFFIKGNGYGSDIKTVKLEAEKCLFLNCFNFSENVTVVFKDSVISYRNMSHEKRLPHYLLNSGRSEIYGCLFEIEETDKNSKLQYGWLGYTTSITNCVFKNIKGRLFVWGTDSNKSEIKNSYFLNCNDILELKGSYDDSFNISDCLFENCLDVIKLTTHSKITNCQFLNCGDSIINGRYGDITIDHCDFIYVKNPTDKKYSIFSEWGIYLHLDNDKDCGKGRAYIQHCYFNGIYHPGFIRYSFDKELSIFSKKITGLTISDCKFKNCIDGIAGIIDKKNYHYDYDNVAIAINNCTEHDNTIGSSSENPVIRKKTAYGEPIGTNITEEDVGVPLYQKALTEN